MKSNNFSDTDQEFQLYMGSLNSSDSYMPFVSHQRVLDRDVSQGPVGDMRSQQGIYVLSPANINQQSAPVQSGISTVHTGIYPDVKHVSPNTVIQRQYSTAHI